MIRRIAIAAIAAVPALSLAAPAFGVAWHQCAASPCTGTPAANYLDERGGNGKPDLIRGIGGRDHLDASEWTRDRDRLYGNRGADTLSMQDGDGRDYVSGGPGHDVCKGDTYRELGPGCEIRRVP